MVLQVAEKKAENMSNVNLKSSDTSDGNGNLIKVVDQVLMLNHIHEQE